MTHQAQQREDLTSLFATALHAAIESDSVEEALVGPVQSMSLACGAELAQARILDLGSGEFVLLPGSVCRQGKGEKAAVEQRRSALAGQVRASMKAERFSFEDLRRLDCQPLSTGEDEPMAALVLPVCREQQLFGVLEFYIPAQFEVDALTVETFKSVCDCLASLVHKRTVVLTASAEHHQTQALLDLIPAMVWYKDTENRILRLNKAAAEFMNLTVSELEGKATEEVYPEDAAKYYADDLEVIKSAQPKWGIVEPITGAGGRERWVRTDKIPVKREDGAVRGVVVFAVDITQDKVKQKQLLQDRRELQSKIEARTQSLRDTESRLENLSRVVPGVLYQYMLQKDGSHQFPYMSESARTILGFDPEEFLNNADLAFGRIHPQDVPLLKEAILASSNTFTQFRFEGRFTTGAGRLIWIQAVSSPQLLPSGDILWNGIVTDVTEMREAQEKIKQLNEDLEQRVHILAAVNNELELLTRKLEVSYDQALEASRLKSEFVANISHEVRTPISAVIGMSEMLLETSLTEEQREFARLLQESARSLLAIINDILDFSKVEAGKIDLENTEFSLTPLVEGCADLLASSARERGLSLMTLVDPTLPRVLVGDPMRLRQVLLNLTSNAIKFTETGSVVVRATAHGEEQEGHVTVLFEVTDTGIGLSESARKLLFQPFVQGDGSTSRKYGGTGLGLSISKRLVELMGGAIGVETQLNSGSRFWFTTPLQAHKLAHDEFEVKEKPIKALVFDKCPSASQIVSSYLVHGGMACDIAASEAEFLSLLQTAATAQPYNVAMIGTAGDITECSDLLNSITACQALHRTKLILISPFDDREHVENAQAHGISICLSKPVRQAQLIETVTRIFSQPTEPPAQAAKGKIKSDQVDSAELLASDKPILIAEDNPVMQQLAVRRIRKMGLNARAVSNGREVLEAVKEQQFALILMDCQMPELDGFEATQVIRREEAETGKHTPIVAMTAAAMVGDREHCITAGMDDYLSKPVSQEQLMEVLRKWLPTKRARRQADERALALKADSEPSAANLPIDLNKLKKLYGDDDTAALLESFVKESGEIALLMEDFFGQRDAQQLAMQAHQLKGLASVMTADSLSHACRELESAVKQHQWADVASLIGTVKEELARALGYSHSLLTD